MRKGSGKRMGCDITLFCEGYIKEKWINIDRWYRKDDWAEIMVTDTEGFDYVDLIDGNRDYGLFYLLAGVRGSEAYNSYPPISPPKGLPEERDGLLKKEYNYDNLPDNANFHHASYLTLRELKESGYGGLMRLKGWVDPDEFEYARSKVQRGEKHQSHFVDVKEDEYRREGKVYKEWDGYINLNLTYMIEKMEQLKKERQIVSDDEVRIVFWFDN